MNKLTPYKKAKLLKLESQIFKTHAQALKSLASLEDGADHPIAEMLLAQIETSVSNLKQIIRGNSKSEAENLFQDISTVIASAKFEEKGGAK